MEETSDYSRVGPVSAAILHLLRFSTRNRRGIQATLPRLEAAAEDHRGEAGPGQ